jgi:hypothetical protein
MEGGADPKLQHQIVIGLPRASVALLSGRKPQLPTEDKSYWVKEPA